MAWSNFQKLWLPTLLLIGAGLSLVLGEYATCPTTKGEKLSMRTELQNAAYYEEKRCTAPNGKCCAEKGPVSMAEIIKVECSASCTRKQVDCSRAANRCRSVADVTGYYKYSGFVSCPYYGQALSIKLPGTRIRTTETLCPSTDTCGVGSFIFVRNGAIEYYYSLFTCMNHCKVWKAAWLKDVTYTLRIVTDCTACSGTNDCKLKYDKPTCPTIRGTLYTKEEIESQSSYEEKTCSDSEKCCLGRTKRGHLAIEIECSDSCVSPRSDCTEGRFKCMDLADIRRSTSTYYKPCLSHKGFQGVQMEWTDGEIPKFDNFETVLCPKSEKCVAFRFEYEEELKMHTAAFAGCLNECKEFTDGTLRHLFPVDSTICKECYTADDCRKILQFNDTRKLKRL